MEAATVTVSRLGASTEGVWLRSRNWDLTFLILSAALVPIPLIMYHGLGISQTAVNLIVAGLIGGPHLYSTFTYTVMQRGYRQQHKAFLLGSLAAAGDRDGARVHEHADPADAVLHVGVDPRAAPDQLHQRLLRGQAAGQAAAARQGHRLRRDLHVPVPDGHAAGARRRVPARRRGDLRAGLRDDRLPARPAHLRGLRAVRDLPRAVDRQEPARLPPGPAARSRACCSSA